MARACVVAERLGLSRDEALSIGMVQHHSLLSSPNNFRLINSFLLLLVCTVPASLCVYTEMNRLQTRLTQHL